MSSRLNFQHISARNDDPLYPVQHMITHPTNSNDGILLLNQLELNVRLQPMNLRLQPEFVQFETENQVCKKSDKINCPYRVN